MQAQYFLFTNHREAHREGLTIVARGALDYKSIDYKALLDRHVIFCYMPNALEEAQGSSSGCSEIKICLGVRPRSLRKCGA